LPEERQITKTPRRAITKTRRRDAGSERRITKTPRRMITKTARLSLPDTFRVRNMGRGLQRPFALQQCVNRPFPVWVCKAFFETEAMAVRAYPLSGDFTLELEAEDIQ